MTINKKQISSMFKSLMVLACSTMAGLAHSAGLLTPVGTGQPLEMLEHTVDVRIQDGFAITTVEQVFSNPGKSAQDAHYRFPIPNRAAVGEFTYWVHGQAIHGEVLEKDKAKKIVAQEKQAGRKVAVAEQQGYKHFDIQVSQIQPGEDTRIRLVYLQATNIDHGIGRYVYPLEDGGTDNEQSQFWTMKETVTQKFSFNLELRSGFAVDAVRLPKHPQAKITQTSSQQWQASIQSLASPAINSEQQEHSENPNFSEITQDSDAAVLNNDIVFYWRLPQGTPGALDVLAYKETASSTGTVMVTLTPADDLQVIQEGTDWTLVLDISGSMQGKFSTLIEGVKNGLTKFNPQDRVRVILFNDSAINLTRGFVQATPANLQDIIQRLEHTEPNNGTNLMQGVKMALSHIEADRTSAIWLVTDGVANVGETAQRAFLELLTKKDIRLFTFIMGNGANRPLLEGLSKASNGFAINVSNSDDIVGQLEKAASKVTHAAMHDIQVKINGVKVKDIRPQQMGSLYRGQQLQIFGHYWQGGPAELVITGKRSGENVEYRMPIVLPNVNTEYPELERLWAYSQIQDLLEEQHIYGEQADRKDAVIDLAKEYSLVTPYTSMLVLEEAQFKQYGIERKNQQRINKEQQARDQRKNQPIVDRNQAASHPVLSQPRSTLGGGGSIDWKWGILLICFVYSRRNFRKLMS